jgi:hypothetical protein
MAKGKSAWEEASQGEDALLVAAAAAAVVAVVGEEASLEAAWLDRWRPRTLAEAARTQACGYPRRSTVAEVMVGV